MADKTPANELLVCIVKDHHHVEEILTGFLELGIRGATVIDGRGMGQILSTEIPIFAGFSSLFPGSSQDTYVIMSVLEADQVEEAIGLTEDICGTFCKAGAGFLFTVPVSRVQGLAGDFS